MHKESQRVLAATGGSHLNPFAFLPSRFFEPFLIKFQRDRPIVPFLAPALDCLLWSLLARVVKKEILKAANTSSELLRIDLKKPDSIVAAATFDIGLAAKDELCKISESLQHTVFSFLREELFTKSHGKATFEILVDKSCMHASWIQLVCFLPTLVKNMCIALEVLMMHQWLTGLEAERTYRSYVEVCSLSSVQAALEVFDRKEQRLDTLLELCSWSHKKSDFCFSC